MRVLVCGGAGYIGSHMVRRLVRAGHEPVIFDNFSTGHRDAAERAFKGKGAGIPPHIVEGDLRDKAALAALFERLRFDAVMHFSALIFVGESVQQPGPYYDNNVAGTLGLLSAMRDAGVDTFVFSSSAAVYGTPERAPVVETMPLLPINPYGRTKHMAELMIADFAAAYGLKGAALRYFNAAGADPEGDLGEAHDPENHLIPNAVNAALGKAPALNIFGDDYPTPDGTCVRDYVHVCDLADAHLLAIEHLARQSGGFFDAFNLGTGQGHSVLDVVRGVEAVGGRPVPRAFAPRRPGDPPFLYADAAKARETLGWRPQYVEIEDIIHSAWKWHSRA